jgi:AcrR family transcriptional regulator
MSPTTEEKIKSAARMVFHTKGFAATKTRDIAKEAGINLALLNYYFRSKEKLFQIIMMDSIHSLFQSILPIFFEEETNFFEKIEKFVSLYIDKLKTDPEIPLFILSELQRNPLVIMDQVPFKEIFETSVFHKQYESAIEKKELNPISYYHLIMNLAGLTVFPFIGKPIFFQVGNLTSEEFHRLMEERKKWIPIWIKQMLTNELQAS